MTRAGRPEVGSPINVRLGDKLLRSVDYFAEAEGVSRAEAIRQLVQRGLRKGASSRGRTRQ
jgi:metal-responsive CopG/Arc/MetJ family transcriptional regulator